MNEYDEILSRIMHTRVEIDRLYSGLVNDRKIKDAYLPILRDSLVMMLWSIDGMLIDFKESVPNPDK